MSKQLALSACVSIFAMLAFALSTAPTGSDASSTASSHASNETGAPAQANAPDADQIAPALIEFAR